MFPYAHRIVPVKLAEKLSFFDLFYDYENDLWISWTARHNETEYALKRSETFDNLIIHNQETMCIYYWLKIGASAHHNMLL